MIHSENQGQKAATETLKKKEGVRKFHVNLDQAVSNSLLTLEAAKTYLESNIKVNGLRGKLGELVKVSQTDKKDKQKNTLVISSDNTMKFSKRYVKYLIKKYLKRENISLYLRVISSGPNGYLVKLFQRNVE